MKDLDTVRNDVEYHQELRKEIRKLEKTISDIIEYINSKDQHYKGGLMKSITIIKKVNGVD